MDAAHPRVPPAAVAAALAFAAPVAGAQPAVDFPRRPITLTIAFAPGGVVDLAGRLIAQRMSELLKTPVVAETRAGAGGNVAAAALARAPADGHTLMFTAYTTLPVSKGLGARLDFDPLKDIVPVALVGANTNLLVVRPDLPARSLPELVALAKAKPGALTFGTIGHASSFHLGSRWLQGLAGVEWIDVHFKGGGPAMTELLAGRIDLMFATASIAGPLMKAGKLRALALGNAARSTLHPDLPTIAESGYPAFDLTGGLALFAPGATPAPVLDRLATTVQQVKREPVLAERLAAEGLQLSTMTRHEFALDFARQALTWERLARQHGITLD